MNFFNLRQLLMVRKLKISSRMKAVLVLYYLVISVVAKNVFNFNNLKEGLESEQQKRDSGISFDTGKYKLGNTIHHEKRDAKNVFNSFVVAVKQEQNEKREQVVIQEGSSTLLQSILPQLKSISIFAGYVRDNKEINQKTESVSESLLIISPTDEAMTTKLNGLKPWEFPKDLTDGNEDEIVESNLSYFIANHVVLKFEDLKISEKNIHATLLSGKGIEITEIGGKIQISCDGNVINVVDAIQVDNGYIFIIDDTLVKP